MSAVGGPAATLIKEFDQYQLQALTHVSEWHSKAFYCLSVRPLYMPIITRLWTDSDTLVLSPFNVQRSCGAKTRAISYNAKMKDGSPIPHFIIPIYEPNILKLEFSSDGPQKKGDYVFSITGSVAQVDSSETLLSVDLTIKIEGNYGPPSFSSPI